MDKKQKTNIKSNKKSNPIIKKQY